MDFASSPRATLGVEWELALTDHASGELTGRAAEMIEELGDRRIVGEFLTNTIELVSSPHQRVDAVIAELGELRDRVAAVGDRLGIDAIGAGTHPFSPWQMQTVAPSARYLRVIDHAGTWGRQLSIWGVHVHIGVPDTKYVVPVSHAILADLPLLLALSTSSPYWDGIDTGYASNRTMLFQQLPTAGLPPEFDTWDEVAEIVEASIAAGIADDYRELRWDVRPSARYGTVEARIADSMPTLGEVAASTALAQCVAEEAMRAVDAGEAPRRLRDWAVAENKFRAARYGFDTEFITSNSGTVRRGREHLADRLDALVPIANDLGCAAELVSALAIAADPSVARQRRAFRSGGRDAVVRLLRDEFRR